MTSRTLWLATLTTTTLALATTVALSSRPDGDTMTTPLASASAGQLAPLTVDLTTTLEQAPGDGRDGNMGPDGGGGGGPGGGGPGATRGDGDNGPPGFPNGEGGPGGRGGHRGDGPPGLNGMGMNGGPNGSNFHPPTPDAQRNYMELVVRYGELAKDPSMTGVSAVITANELLRSRGAQAGIEYFKRVLPDVKDATVQRAIRLMLIDLYRRAGENDAALAEIDALIRNQPSSAPATTQP